MFKFIAKNTDPITFTETKPIQKTTGTVLGMDDSHNVISLPPDTRLNKHTVVYGASGTGKSRCFVRNQIMQCVSRRESIVVTDSKGELYTDSAQFLRDNGYDVKVFNLADPKHSHSWNCIREIGTEPRQAEILAQIFADAFIKNTSEGKGDYFWDNAEMLLLQSLILYVVLDSSRPDGLKNINAVYEMLTGNTDAELEAKFDMLNENHPALSSWEVIKKASENVRRNIIIGLAVRMQTFLPPEIINITSSDDIDVEAPAREKCGYFVILPEQSTSASDCLSSLFFSFMLIKTAKYAELYGRNGMCDIPVNFILDDFQNIGRIPDFAKRLAIVRLRDIRVALVFQNITQLQSKYPKGIWEEIINNCDTQLFFGGAGQPTVKFISNSLIKAGSDLTYDDIANLSDKYCLIIIKNQEVLAVKKYDFSNHPAASQLQYKPI
jgi:type IV secretion system protein VirD4